MPAESISSVIGSTGPLAQVSVMVRSRAGQPGNRVAEAPREGEKDRDTDRPTDDHASGNRLVGLFHKPGVDNAEYRRSMPGSTGRPSPVSLNART